MEYLNTFSSTSNNDNQFPASCTFRQEQNKSIISGELVSTTSLVYKSIFKIAFSLLLMAAFKPSSFGQTEIINFGTIDKITSTAIAYNDKVSVSGISDLTGAVSIANDRVPVAENNISYEKPKEIAEIEETVTELPKKTANSVFLRVSNPVQSTIYKICEEHLEINSLVSGEVLLLESIYFAVDSNEPLDLAGLDQLVDLLQSYTYLKVTLKGSTDSRGDSDYNLLLAQSRAEKVKKQIVRAGIDADRIKTRAVGESRLINDCAEGVNCSDQLHAQNRRVDFLIQVSFIPSPGFWE